MSPEDLHELRWWREVFATRFLRDNLPSPGTALYGMRLVLMVDDAHGEYPYEARRGAA